MFTHLLLSLYEGTLYIKKRLYAIVNCIQSLFILNLEHPVIITEWGWY